LGYADDGISASRQNVMAGSRTRLKDIAGVTGFSANTVSLALRGSPRIPRETRDLIVAEAKRQNYLPNQVARSLVSRATKTIGLVLPDIMNPTLTETAQAIERRLLLHGYGTMFTATDNVLAQELKALEAFRSRQVDGILIYPVTHRRIKHVRLLRQAGYPIVLLVADPDAGVDVVCINDREGAYKAVRHLLDLGHRRVATLDAALHHGNREKLDGYAKALAEAGIAVDPALVIDPGGHGATAAYHVMPQVMAEKPTALFASNDRLAIGALAWCREHGVAVPGGLAIVGYDDIEAASFCGVPLTTMHYRVDEVADQAVARLLALIDHGDKPPPPQVVQFAPELVVRESCGATLKSGKRRRRA
jgi:LacI family transcriptional regulator, galactose operon repressor